MYTSSQNTVMTYSEHQRSLPGSKIDPSSHTQQFRILSPTTITESDMNEATPRTLVTLSLLVRTATRSTMHVCVFLSVLRGKNQRTVVKRDANVM